VSGSGADSDGATALEMVEPIRLAMVAGVALVVSLAGSGMLVRVLRFFRVEDVPNDRSSHVASMPRGGGLAVLGAVLIAWTAGIPITGEDTVFHPLILGGTLLLVLVSLLDDVFGLPAFPRLIAQMIAVVPGILLLQVSGGLFEGVVSWQADLALTALVWLWFINLYNFMDGIDGLAAVETVSLGIGLAGMAALGLVVPGVLDPAVALAAAALGFLVLNWQPARIFLGDVGSIPLGYLLGWLLIQLGSDDFAGSSGWAAALILPGYFLADATITLVRRALRGRNVMQAHREHFYQRALDLGRSHATVCRRVILANAALVLVSWCLPVLRPEVAIAMAALIVTATLGWMIVPGNGGRRSDGR